MASIEVTTMHNDKDAGDAKDVICALIAAAGGSLHGKVRLYKGFYHAHLIHWKQNHGLLTQYPIVHMPMGPGIDGAAVLLDELEAEGRINVGSEGASGQQPEQVYTLLAPSSIPDSDPRHDAIQQAYARVKDKTGAQLSEETHRDSRSWNRTLSGQEMDIYTDMLDEAEYGRIHATTPQVEELVYSAFGLAF